MNTTPVLRPVGPEVMAADLLQVSFTLPVSIFHTRSLRRFSVVPVLCESHDTKVAVGAATRAERGLLPLQK